MNNRSWKMSSLRNASSSDNSLPSGKSPAPRKHVSGRTMPSWKNMTLSAVALGTVLAVSSCGSGGDEQSAPSAAPSSSPSVSASASGSPSASPETSPSLEPSASETGMSSPSSALPGATPPAGGTAGEPVACAASGLAGEVEETQGGGAAGSVYRTLVLTNVSPEACTAAAGFPGVSYTDGSGEQIGAAAVRSGEGPAAGASFVLEPGQSMAAELKETRAENYGADCESHQATQLMVYPPEDLESLTIEHPILACENPNVELLTISTLQKR